MRCQRLKYGVKWLAVWHRLWCRDCRAARSVDALIARGVAQMQAQAAPRDGLGRTLWALELADAGAAEPLLLRRFRAPIAARRIAIVAALAVVGVYLATSFVSHTGTAALAETVAALKQVSSYHVTGVQVEGGREERLESWYSAGRLREDEGNVTTIDDGRQRRRYKAGTKVVLVDRSSLASNPHEVGLFQPGGFLRRIEEMSRLPGWSVRVEKRSDKTPEGRPVQRFEIDATMDSHAQKTHDQTGKVVLLIDPSTKLPVFWAGYELQGDRWQLRGRMDRFEYDVAVPDRIFQLSVPAGTRIVDADRTKLDHARLAVQRTARGAEVVLRGIEVTAEGDIFISVAREAPGHAGEAPTAEVMFVGLVDDQGTEYVDAHINFFARTYITHWLVPLTPRPSRAPLPRALTISTELVNGQVVTFRNIPAPPPAFESVMEVPPVNDFVTDAKQVEQIRAKARAHPYRLGEHGGGSGSDSRGGAPAR